MFTDETLTSTEQKTNEDSHSSSFSSPYRKSSAPRDSLNPIFNIVRPIKVIAEWRNEEKKVNNTRELNIVSWNGGQPRIDIRSWYIEDGSATKKAGKGVSLNDAETRLLCEALVNEGYYK